MNITFTKSELLELLGINNRAYNYLVSTNQLEYKLSLKGYKDGTGDFALTTKSTEEYLDAITKYNNSK